MIIILISEQRLYHRRRTGVWHTYPVSTSDGGIGNKRNSLKTPAGKHRICARIGEGFPKYTVFIGRQPTGIFNPKADNPNQDWILSRILWLEGMELGVNRRGLVDTKSRFIYIHGTHNEDRIGTPCSHGCIRMRNHDILDLFEHVCMRERVLIR